MTVKNPFQHIVEPLDPKEPKRQFYNLSKLGDPRYGKQFFARSLSDMCSRKVHCLSVPQTACPSPSVSFWSLLSGIVMSFWWNAQMWKAFWAGSRPRLRLWRSHLDQPVSYSRTSRMWISFIGIWIWIGIAINRKHLRITVVFSNYFVTIELKFYQQKTAQIMQCSSKNLLQAKL